MTDGYRRRQIACLILLWCLAGASWLAVTAAWADEGVMLARAAVVPLEAAKVSINVGSGTAAPGSTVSIEVSLVTGGEAVAGVANYIIFDPAVVDLVKASDCSINPAISDNSDIAGCDEDPQTAPCKDWVGNLADCPGAMGCPEGSEGFRRFAGFVLATINVNPIPDGVLYTCTFTVTGEVGETAALLNRDIMAANPTGTDLHAGGSDGQIAIEPMLCNGDCNGDGEITVDEVITGINIALGNISVCTCMPCDTDDNGGISIAELIKAVDLALTGCPFWNGQGGG